ncbi:MAG: putative transporter component [Chitinophagaceae bacterium]|nr:putative transporter component [Chitinophagaceae bacterium]
MEWIYAPWPWYVAGPIIGLMVPALYLAGNKSFGISSTLRHICAACIPTKVPFFHYDWKKENWNLVFVAGITIGAFIAANWFRLPGIELELNPTFKQQFTAWYGFSNYTELLPVEVFGIKHLWELRTLIFSLFGGFLVGFGTRYAGGCTSGHAITGLSTLQWPSLVATVTFMIAGIFASWFIVPFLLSL